MEFQLFLDTNALLNLQESAFKEHFVIAQKTLEEIENIKVSANRDDEIRYKARKIAHLLDDKFGSYTVIPYNIEFKDILLSYGMNETPDNIILVTAKKYNDEVEKVIFCTDDINCKFLAKNIFSLETKGVNDLNLVKNINEYLGYKDITLSDEEMSNFYCNLNDNIFDCVKNEYLIVRKSDKEIVDYRRWNGKEYVALSYKQLNSKFLGKIKPRNPQQVLAFDMLQNKDETIKVLCGGYGTGKSYLMIANALKLIEEGKFDKLIYIRNPIEVKDVGALGYLPGTEMEKMLPYVMVLADHLGGENGLELQIMSGNIEVQHLGHIRGRDLKNSIIYVTEAENLTKEHVQLLIGRVGEGSNLWLDGDIKQVDSPTFKINNGLLASVNKLNGHEKFGYVKLKKTERSETAAMADLLD